MLSGDIDQNAPDKVYNSFHVVITSDVDSTTVIDGFTIIGGNANGSDLNSFGGGMFNENSSPTITNTIS